jgi:hypothetical protein
MSPGGPEERKLVQRRVEECQEEMQRLRRGSPSQAEVVALANRLGRVLRKGYGDHPSYQSAVFPHLRTLTIPGHRTLKRGTALKILRQLEVDLDAWKGRLKELGGPSSGEGN